MQNILEQNPGNYYMDVREFNGGSIEALLKCIRPMHEGAILASADPLSYSNYCKEHGLPINLSTRLTYTKEPTEHSEFEKSDNHHRAVRRAKQNIRWLTKQIEADRLLTLTYRKNQENREEVKANFKRFLWLLRHGWKGQSGESGWRYVAVLEKQERGAYHIHCAVQGRQNINFLRLAWYKALGGQGNETGEGTPGQIDITSPHKARWGTKRSEWKASKLSAYLTKYLSKTFDEDTEEKKRYWHSKDTVKPAKERFILCAKDFVSAITEAARILYLHYGHTINFRHSWIPKSEDSLWLSLGEAT